MVVIYGNMDANRQTVKHVGNKTKILLETNQDDLILIGNRSRIQVEHNKGSIKIVGDNCAVTVVRNSGSVRYVGNKGEVIIGSESESKDVKYTGNAGVLKYMDGAAIERTENEKFRSRKGSIKKNSKLYHSDGDLNVTSVLNEFNSFFTNFSMNLDFCSTDSFINADTTAITKHGISVVNGNIVINNLSS